VRVPAVLRVRKIDELPEHTPNVDWAHLNHGQQPNATLTIGFAPHSSRAELANGVAGVQAARIAQQVLPVFHLFFSGLCLKSGVRVGCFLLSAFAGGRCAWAELVARRPGGEKAVTK
jgi:hypothetical protein